MEQVILFTIQTTLTDQCHVDHVDKILRNKMMHSRRRIILIHMYTEHNVKKKAKTLKKDLSKFQKQKHKNKQTMALN